MAVVSDRLRRTIQRLIVPTADLGLSESDVPPLAVLDDVPVVLALAVNQMPSGKVRTLKSSISGRTGFSIFLAPTLLRSATDAAGNSGNVFGQDITAVQFFIEVIALTGAPTNIQYRPAISFDASTWYEGGNAQATGAGLVQVAIGVSVGLLTSGNNILASTGINQITPPYGRLDWVFTGGTNPKVQHKIWVSYG